MCCLFQFTSPDRASRHLAALRLYRSPSPLAHDPHCILPSTSLCHRSLPFPPVTGRAAQPPEFSPRDVVGLTWYPCAILPPSRLTALIRPFLEPDFPQRWSDSDVGVDARPGQPGRSLPNPAPRSPPLLSLFPSAFLKGLLSNLPRFPSHAGIENASPSRLPAAPLTTPFLVDLHASSPEARTWKIGRGRQYEAINEGNAASPFAHAWYSPTLFSNSPSDQRLLAVPGGHQDWCYCGMRHGFARSCMLWWIILRYYLVINEFGGFSLGPVVAAVSCTNHRYSDLWG